MKWLIKIILISICGIITCIIPLDMILTFKESGLKIYDISFYLFGLSISLVIFALFLILIIALSKMRNEEK